MRFEGRVHRVGHHVNTDVIIPGRYLTLRDQASLGRHCLEGVDPTFAARVRPGDILVAGRNFGSGSSREHAVLALKGAGIAAIIAESVARIFFRNAINLGLPVIVSPEIAGALQEDDVATVDLGGGEVRQGRSVMRFQPFVGQVGDILEAGGLVEYLRAALPDARRGDCQEYRVGPP